jgi:phospholipase C
MNCTPQIEYVVVLMMENHSFDNMLGWLPGVGELTGDESNEYDGQVYTICAKPRTFDTNPGPAHEFCNVNMQLFENHFPAEGAAPTTAGFVQDYANPAGQHCGGCAEVTAGPGENVMACYLPDQVPVISLLAQTFTVCRRWFCSVPGPTGPNRIYANCASSGGYAGSNYQATLDCIPGAPGMMPKEMAGLASIFGVLAGSGAYNWGIYHEDPPVDSTGPAFSPELILNDVRANPAWVRHDPGFTKFYSDLESGNLPNYSFLTPNLCPNSQHPGADVRHGECVMANIYEAIANSSYWEKTLFIITYDEHGGFYDSVLTPTDVPNPDNQNWTPGPSAEDYPSPWFSFDRLGVRVPAILISPYVAAAVDDTQYEHSSIVATVLKLFGLTWPVPNQRLATVNTFEKAWGSTLRKDLPMRLPRPPTGTGGYVPLRPLLPG